MRCARGGKIAGLVILGLFTAGLLGLLLGLVVMGLWNALMPDLFGLAPIGYWQAVGLFILAHLLFKSPGCHTGHGEERRPSAHGGRFKEKIKAWLEKEAEGSEAAGAGTGEGGGDHAEKQG